MYLPTRPTSVRVVNAATWESTYQSSINVWLRPMSAAGYGQVLTIVDQENQQTGFGFTQTGAYVTIDHDQCSESVDAQHPSTNWFQRDYRVWTMWTFTSDLETSAVYRNGAFLFGCTNSGSSGGLASGGSYFPPFRSAYFGGAVVQLAEFQFLSRKVSDAEVLTLYASPSSDVSFSTTPGGRLNRVGFLGSGSALNDTELAILSGTPVYAPCNCDVEPCQNSISCVDGTPIDTATFRSNCTCVPGYQGYLCQTDIDECASAPCRNGGTCTDYVNGFTCACVGGWSGLTCRTDINECASAPCQNGGTCTDLVNGYTCACVIGYSGLQCQTDINECASSPCHDGRTCVDGVNSYRCVDGTEPYCEGGLAISSPSSTPAASGAYLLGATTLQAPFTIAYWTVAVNDSAVDVTGGFLPTAFSIVDPDAVPPSRGASIGIGFSPLGLTLWFGGEACIANVSRPSSWTEYTGVGKVTGAGTVSLELYVNGERVAQTDYGVCNGISQPVAAVPGRASLVHVGRRTRAVVSNLRFWKYAWSAADILTDFKFRSHYTAESGPELWYPTATALTAGNQRGVAIAPALTFLPGVIRFRDCDCRVSPCAANLTCVDNPGRSFPCNCSTPFFDGLACEHNINDCASSPCQHGGTCVDLLGAYNCTCVHPYSGPQCQYNSTEGGGSYLTSCEAPRNETVYSGTTLSLGLYHTVSRYCERQYDKAWVFDPSAAWCLTAARRVNVSDVLYRNLQQGCADRGRFLSAAYWNPVPPGDSCEPFAGWGNNIGPYFQSLCDSGESYDYAVDACVPDERTFLCGLGTSSCTKKCYWNAVCDAVSVRCNCSAGHDHGDPRHCGYKIETDFCPAATGLSGSQESRSALCGVFTEDSFYECTTSTYASANCTERCTCKLGTGDTPGSSIHCRGQEVPCTAQNSLEFCGVADGRCVKRCEFAPPFTRPSFCAFVEGSCGSTAHFPSQVCVAEFTQGYSQQYALPTYRYNPALPFEQQTTTLEQYPFSCLCDTAHTGMKCSFNNCPEGCDDHGTCVNGRCVCDADWTGCGCQIAVNPLCTTDGAACDGNPVASPECELCTDLGTCSPSYDAFDQPSYACICDATHLGEFCATSACPSDCSGASHGRCVVPSNGNKTAATCECRSEASCSGGDNLYAGDDCSVNVCAACGSVNPGSSGFVTCSGNGVCVRDNSTAPFHCACEAGFTGAQCQNQPCSPACGLHASCTSNGVVFSCVCDLGYTDLTGSSTCVTNRCGPRALPIASRSGETEFDCQCTNATMDNSQCTTNAAHNAESCCSTRACPLDPLNGVVCGDNAQDDVYHIVPPPSCVDGTCDCGYAFAKNATSGTCLPYCDQAHTVPAARPCTVVLGQVQCTSCSCTAGYDPATRCYETVCQNGGTLVVASDGVTFACNCADSFGGTFCEQPACSGRGSVNTTTGVCACAFPYTGDTCTETLCQNGGIVNGNACACRPKWSGRTCEDNTCAPGGIPSADGVSCVCSGAYTGTQCHTSRCLNGGTAAPLSDVCDCSTAPQYTGVFCQRRLCGPLGTYTPSNQTCACPVNGVVVWNATVSACTAICGPFGSLTATADTCDCGARTTVVSVPAPDHPVLCEPVCGAHGVYNATQLACVCTSPGSGVYCDPLPSSTAASSSSSTADERSNASPRTVSSLFWPLALFSLTVCAKRF